MGTIDNESINLTTKQLVDDAISGIRNKIAQLSIAVYKEMPKNPETARQLDVELSVIRGSLWVLKSIRETL